ncbi:hypothetical protein CRUP_020480, partial [Coryphaenoides rupestris]
MEPGTRDQGAREPGSPGAREPGGQGPGRRGPETRDRGPGPQAAWTLTHAADHRPDTGPDRPQAPAKHREGRMRWVLRLRCSRNVCLAAAASSLLLHLLLLWVSSSSVFRTQPCNPRRRLSSPPPSSSSSSSSSTSSSLAPARDVPLDTSGLAPPPGGTAGAGPGAGAGFKLQVLFSHPLYHLPAPPVPEDDWLLKVKPKVQADEDKSSLM